MNRAPKLGILAGGGTAPSQIIQACQASGRPFFVFCLKGYADPELGTGHDHAVVALGEIRKVKDLCAREKIEEMVMIGGVRRPSIAEIKPDWLAVKLLTKIGLGSLGDDALLQNVGRVIEQECGVRMVGAGEVMKELLSPQGVLTQKAPDDQAKADIGKGIEVAKALGACDIGQAVVVQQGLVLAVEAIEGTQALIDRAGTLKREGGGGVLVKCAKPQQDDRFDLPSIGVQTIEQVHQAGFSGIAVQAGRSLLIDKEAMLALADKLGLFVVGVAEDQA
ncbi:MAG: LpxI family protein [Bdellovibrionales bacterium]